MEELYDELRLLRQIEEEFHKIVMEVFPDMKISGGGSAARDFHAYFPKENRLFENTDYFYRGERIFFHLTDIRSLFSILNSRSIRMYNLHGSADETEFAYSASLFNARKDEIDARKNRIFTFSFCPLSELSNRRMWQEYGKEFAGVAIVFEVVNDPIEWVNYHMSPIKYALSKPIEIYVRKIDLLKDRYLGSTFYLELEKLMAFHKHPRYQYEKEVRILTYSPYSIYEEWLKFVKRELKLAPGRNRFVEYIELPLWVDNSSGYLNSPRTPLLDRRQTLPSDDYFTFHPQIRIRNILFGDQCGLNWKDFQEVKDKIESQFPFQFGYTIQLDINPFKVRVRDLE